MSGSLHEPSAEAATGARVTMEASDAPTGVRRRIVHVFVWVLLLIIATSAAPTLHPGQDVVRQWLDPFVDGVGLWQGQWALFGPEPDKINVVVVGLVEFADGARAEWRHPEWGQLSGLQKFRFFRFMEFTDGIRRDQNRGAWPAFAEYVVRVRPHPTDPSVPAARVTLWRQSVVIPAPQVPLRPLADPFPMESQQLFYTRVFER